MKLLVVTNLYPPQELGGYGRSIADFVWGLRERGHSIQVLSTDEPHLGAAAASVRAEKQWTADCNLKGVTKEVCVHFRIRSSARPLIRPMPHSSATGSPEKTGDGILLGNLDLLGPELLPALLEAPCIVQHHVGFVHAPFPPSAWPQSDRYRLVAASGAVRSALVNSGLPTSTASVVYPGVRSELFGIEQVGMPIPSHPMAVGTDP